MSVIPLSVAKPIIPVLGSITDRLSPLALPMIRATTGLLLLPHGSQKLFGAFGGYGLAATGQFFAAKLGLPASFALLAGLIEFGGGLLLALGLATRAAAALVFGLMAVAVVQVHLANDPVHDCPDQLQDRHLITDQRRVDKAPWAVISPGPSSCHKTSWARASTMPLRRSFTIRTIRCGAP